MYMSGGEGGKGGGGRGGGGKGGGGRKGEGKGREEGGGRKGGGGGERGRHKISIIFPLTFISVNSPSSVLLGAWVSLRVALKSRLAKPGEGEPNLTSRGSSPTSLYFISLRDSSNEGSVVPLGVEGVLGSGELVSARAS